jgi:hypothetical protein
MLRCVFGILYIILVLCTLAVIGASFVCYRHIRGHLEVVRRQQTGVGIEDGEIPATVNAEPGGTQQNSPKL